MDRATRNRIFWAYRRYRHHVRRHGPSAPETAWVRLTLQVLLLEV